MGFVRRRTLTIDGREVIRYLGVYVDPSGRERSRTFDRKKDAARWAQDQTAAVRRGDWSDPDAGRITVAEWAPTWLATKVGKQAKTRYEYRRIVEGHIIERFGRRQLRTLTRADIDTWVGQLQAAGLSGSRIRNIVNPLKMMLDLAVEHGLIPHNPARPRTPGVRTGALELPAVNTGAHVYLDTHQVAALADAGGAIAPVWRLAIYLLAYGGMRWSELVELRAGDIDPMRGRIEISRKAVEVGGEHVLDVRKRGGRARPRLPGFVRDLLVEHIATVDPSGLVFAGDRHPCEGATCRRLRYHEWRRDVWVPARDAAGLKVKPHELRHTCAALLIAGGADPKAVSEHLGHSTITVTMNTYGHLFDDHLDDVLDRLDAGGREAATDVGRTRRDAQVVTLPPTGSGPEPRKRR